MFFVKQVSTEPRATWSGPEPGRHGFAFLFTTDSSSVLSLRLRARPGPGFPARSTRGRHTGPAAVPVQACRDPRFGLKPMRF